MADETPLLRASYALARRRREARSLRRGWAGRALVVPPDQPLPRAEVRVHPSVFQQRMNLTPARHVLTQVPASPVLLHPPLDLEQGPGAALLSQAGGEAQPGPPVGHTLHERGFRVGRPAPPPPRRPPPRRRGQPAPAPKRSAQAPAGLPTRGQAPAQPEGPPPGMLEDPFAGLGIEVIRRGD